MQNKNIIIGLVVLLIILVGIALVNRNKFKPSQQTTATVPTTTQTTTEPTAAMQVTESPAPTTADSTKEMAPEAKKNQEQLIAGSINVQLAAQNGSEQTGAALLKEVDGKVIVSLNLKGGTPGVAQPAHIHLGSCPTPGKIVYPLTDVTNGQSFTKLNVSMAELKAQGALAINVHKSAQDVKTYVACGDIR